MSGFGERPDRGRNECLCSFGGVGAKSGAGKGWLGRSDFGCVVDTDSFGRWLDGRHGKLVVELLLLFLLSSVVVGVVLVGVVRLWLLVSC